MFTCVHTYPACHTAIAASSKGGSAAAAAAVPQQSSGFGLSKLAIATTAAGKLCAISTITGDIVWSKLLPTAATATNTDSSSSSSSVRHSVYVTRPKNVLGYPPEFALLSTAADGTATVAWYDALTGAKSSVDTSSDSSSNSSGAASSDLVFQGGISSVVPLDLHDAEGRQILMIVSK